MLDWLLDIGIFVVVLRAFKVQPKISKEGDILVATTGWTLRMMTLFAASRRMLVDPKQKAVRICDRCFWFFDRWHRIPFDMVESIIYSYSDVSPGQLSWSGAYREMDLFDVKLRLRDGEERRLFRFFGQGEFVNNSIFPDWWYWNDTVMTPLIQGDQENQSRAFVNVLSGLIGAPVTSVTR
jgi:hypothetical protein